MRSGGLKFNLGSPRRSRLMEEFVGLSILRIGKIIPIFLETENCDDDDKWRLGKNTFELSKELYNERKDRELH